MRPSAFLFVCVLCSSAFAQEVGDTVVVIAESEAELKRGTNVVGTVDRGNHLRVDKVNGAWLSVKWKGKTGWIHNSNVIHFDKAIDFFTAAIGRNPTAYDYAARGWIWSDKGEFDIAIGDYNEAIRLNPTQDDAWNHRGKVWYDKGEYDKAMADYNEAIRLDPKNNAAYSNRGNVWHVKSEYDKAIADYTDAIRLDPKEATPYSNRGSAWRNKGEYDRAIADFNQAIRLHPKYASAYSNRGNAWDGKGEYDKAIADYNEAIRLNPKHANAHNNRGDVWHDKGEYDKALADYNEAIRLAPKDRWAYSNRAWLMATCPVAKHRDGQRAVRDATKACELTEWKNAGYMNTLAAAYAELGKFDKAVESQEKAIALLSDDDEDKDDYHSRLELYKSDKPYRDEPKEKD